MVLRLIPNRLHAGDGIVSKLERVIRLMYNMFSKINTLANGCSNQS